MFQTDAQSVMQDKVKVWERDILDYVEKYSHNMVARQVLPVRQVGKEAAIDVVQTYKSRGRGAIIAAKGAIPRGSGAAVTSTEHTIVQILDGFNVHEKDLAQDAKYKSRNIDICMRNVHKAEDELAVNGDSAMNIDGITDAPATANTIATTANNGAWNGTEANDIYQDIVTGIGMIDTDFEPHGILGNPTDINYLNGMSSERQPYWKEIVDLFASAKKKEDFLYKSNRVTAGNVYIFVKDVQAAELVVSENAMVANLPMQRGRNYPVEVYEWVTVEIHNNDCFVKISTA